MLCIRHFVSILLLCLVAAAGCSIGTEPSQGELGRVELVWSDGIGGCLLGCDAEGRLALGGAGQFTVQDPERFPGMTASSPDGTLLVEYESDSGWLGVTGATDGEGTLEFHQDGALVDRFRWEVRPVASVEVADRPVETLVLAVDTFGREPLTLRDDSGIELRGVGAVAIESADEDLFLAQAVPLSGLAETLVGGSNQELLQVDAFGIGEGTMILDNAAGDRRLAIPVRVVGDDAIDRVELEVTARYERDGEPTAEIDAVVFAGGQRVMFAPCTWSATEGARLDTLARTPSTGVLGRGRHTITCTIGERSETIDVRL